MPATKRTRSSAAKNNKSDAPAQAPMDDDLFATIFERPDQSEHDSDHSEYGRKPKSKRKAKRRKTTHRKPVPAPIAPELSDDEYEDHRAESLALGEYPFISTTQPALPKPKPKRTSESLRRDTGVTQNLPQVLQIQVNTTKDRPATINLDLAGMLLDGDYINLKHSLKPFKRVSSPVGLDLDAKMTPLVEQEEDLPKSSSKRASHSSKKRMSRNAHEGSGFLDLPYEIRVRIYRQVLVTQSPIDFRLRQDFQRSSAFLRTCHEVHNQGRVILYGENAFHFERTEERRGHFFEKVWHEVGFKDVRRFLDTIGPLNRSGLRYVSFLLCDVPQHLSTCMDDEERRFVHDPVLHYIFRLIGSHTTLSKLAFTFGGRRAVSATDFHFLRSITSVRCKEFIHAPSMGSGGGQSKIGDELLEKMRKIMVVDRDTDDVDMTKVKPATVKMYHEKPRPSAYSG